MPITVPEESPPLLSEPPDGDEDGLDIVEVLPLGVVEVLLLELVEEANCAKVALKADGSNTAGFGFVNVWVNSRL